MKNSKYLLLFVVVCILMMLAEPSFCAEVAENIPSRPSTLGSTAIKFLITMGGVALSCVVIWFGLSFYNKFFVKKPITDKNFEDDTLTTPKSKEDAIVGFITRNRLK